MLATLQLVWILVAWRTVFFFFSLLVCVCLCVFVCVCVRGGLHLRLADCGGLLQFTKLDNTHFLCYLSFSLFTINFVAEGTDGK